MEDPSKKFIAEFVDQLAVPGASNTYIITGMRAAYVIAIFKSIVNNREGPYGYIKGNIFTLKIEGRQAISFTLEVNPTNDQPGNGRISRNNKELTHASLTKGVMELCPNSTLIFAEDIKSVFKDKSELLGCRDTVIQDVYNVLLFEIG
mgnify:CR=1 FL=1